MSRTIKEGKRRRGVHVKTETIGIGDAISSRQNWGHTEKIRRRNRKIFTRLANKRRRAIGKQIISAPTET